jgi:flagellar motor switch protein FliM
MPDVLSDNEIEALLNSLGGDRDSEEAEDLKTDSGGRPRKNVKLYDFKRPDKFSRDHQRTLYNMHEQFARLSTTSMSAQLRTLVNFHVASVDQLTYEEFKRSIPSPSCMAIIMMDPLKGNAILEIDPAITFTIIDRLFGGGGSTTKINRELTEIEAKVMEFMVSRMLVGLREAWTTVIDLRPRLSQIEGNPNFIQSVAPNEMCIVITFETKVSEVEGLMNLCLPFVTIEPIIQKLSSQYWYSTGSKTTSSRDAYNVIKDRLASVFVDVIAEIGEIDIKISDLINLRNGDIIKLKDSSPKKDIILKIGSKKKFLCKPGLIGKKVSVQVTQSYEEINPEDERDFLTDITAEEE